LGYGVGEKGTGGRKWESEEKNSEKKRKKRKGKKPDDVR
jgi:hypothetical protein